MDAPAVILSGLGMAALHYGARGLAVFPLHNPTPTGCSCGGNGCQIDPDTGLYKGKHPRVMDWHNAATTDAGVIRGWWERWPAASIGLDCGKSGVVVIDLDPRHGGIEAWEALADTLGLSVATRTARTGTGGLHLYFKMPAGVTIRNSAGKLGHGIDVRGEGGYVVLPPSVHPNGNRYAWE